MYLDPRTLAVINLAVQAFLVLAVFGAAYLARRRRDFRNHCTVMRIALPLQIIAIVFIMLPSLRDHISHGQPGLLNDEMLAHHVLGAAVVVLWVYINLVFVGLIKPLGRPVVTCPRKWYHLQS
jgi:hypothetical protein